MKFGDDWTGLYIRGDKASSYLLQLRSFLRTHPIVKGEENDRTALEELMGLFNSVNELPPVYAKSLGIPMPPRVEVQKMKPFPDAKAYGVTPKKNVE
jgi:hypothetical protein